MLRTINTVFGVFAVIATLLAFSIVVAASVAPMAKATEFDWADHHRAARPHRVARKAKSVKNYRHPIESDGWQCLDRVRVVGSQWIGQDGAEDSARKAFMEEVRWRFGEGFMDIDHARDYERRCSRSSVGEAVGQTFIRCEISARPCRPPMVSK